MAEDFIARLMSDAEVGEDKRITFRKDVLTNHLNELSQSVMAREKLTYERLFIQSITTKAINGVLCLTENLYTYVDYRYNRYNRGMNCLL